MEGAPLIADGLERIKALLDRCLYGVSPANLARQPSPDTNSMGWLVWHLTRVQDDHIMDLAGRDYAWLEGGWHERFGMPAENDFGFGWTPAQVAAFRPESAQLLLDYHADVHGRSLEYLAAITPDELDRVLDEPHWDPRPTVGVRLVSVVNDNTQHAGQIAYLRGLFGGFNWQNA